MKKHLLFALAIILFNGLNAQETMLKEKHQKALNERKTLKDHLISESAFIQDSSLYYQWDINSNSWGENPISRSLYKYDNQGRLTLVNEFIWVEPKNSWRNSYEYHYAYDVNGNEAEFITNLWDTITNAWIPDEHDTLIYNSSSILIKESWNFYNRLNDSWITGNLSQYNDAGVLIELYSKYWDKETYVLEGGSRTILTLNNLNKPTEVILQSLDAQTDNWLNDTQTLSYYTNDILTSDTVNWWSNSSWTANSQKTYTYKDGLKTELLTKSWDIGSLTWLSTYKTSYNYNLNNLLSEQIAQKWAFTTWVNTKKDEYSYDVNNKKTERLTLDWVNNTWIKNYQEISVYDSNNRSIESCRKFFNTSNMQATNGSLSHVIYDENNFIVQKYSQRWSTNLNDWQNTFKTLYFYSPLTLGVLNNKVINCKCLFENPYVIGRPIDCSSLKSNENYKISVFSLSGIKVFQSTFKGGESFKIDTQIANGIYLLLITSHNALIFRNKLMIITGR